MRLTTRGRFAVTAVLDLAMRAGRGPVALADISQRQKISLSYLEQLFGKLRKNQLVNSVRGPGGGYVLAKPADSVSVADIILAVDEPIDATNCAGRQNCRGEEGKCITHDLWEGLNDHIFAFLRSVTLAQLVDEHRQRNPGMSVMEMRDLRPARKLPAAVA